MRASTRLELDMIGRADEFCLRNPDPSPPTAQVAANLHQMNLEGRRLTDLKRTNEVIATTAVSDKAKVRVVITGQLTDLAGISRAAAENNPSITVHRRLPGHNCSEAVFLSTARVAVAEAESQKEVFLGKAMPENLLEDMTANLDQYDALVTRQRNAIATQVGATAQLQAVARAGMGVVRHLDSIHNLRFRNDPERLAAWKSARNVAWRAPDAADPAPGAPASGPKAA